MKKKMIIQDIANLVKADVEKRAICGLAKYGERLSTGTKGDAVQMAYEEALDLAVYLRWEIERQTHRRNK